MCFLDELEVFQKHNRRGVHEYVTGDSTSNARRRYQTACAVNCRYPGKITAVKLYGLDASAPRRLVPAKNWTLATLPSESKPWPAR